MAVLMDASVRAEVDARPDLAGALRSLVRYGSAERGDFVPGHSDLDYFAVVEDDTVVDPLRSVLRTCADPVDHRGIDLAWEYPGNLDDLDAGVRFKFLGVYQWDFRRHHALVYGTDPLPEIPRREFREALPGRLDRLERLASDREDGQFRVLAGEVARLRALLDGADSLRKREVLATLRDGDRTDARRVYAAYLEGAAVGRDGAPPDRDGPDVGLGDAAGGPDEEFLRTFVDRELERMRRER